MEYSRAAVHPTLIEVKNLLHPLLPPSPPPFSPRLVPWLVSCGYESPAQTQPLRLQNRVLETWKYTNTVSHLQPHNPHTCAQTHTNNRSHSRQHPDIKLSTKPFFGNPVENNFTDKSKNELFWMFHQYRVFSCFNLLLKRLKQCCIWAGKTSHRLGNVL